jgi:hypothetical protein
MIPTSRKRSLTVRNREPIISRFQRSRIPVNAPSATIFPVFNRLPRYLWGPSLTGKLPDSIVRLRTDLSSTKVHARLNVTKLSPVSIERFAWSRPLWPLVDER